jgi:PAS domain S-box-containing protein
MFSAGGRLCKLSRLVHTVTTVAGRLGVRVSEMRSFERPAGDDLVYLAAIQQLVLERSHDLITVTDALGTIVYASPSWQSVLGWSPEMLTGTSIVDLVHPDDRRRATDGFESVLGGGDVAGITARFKTHDGRWVPIETSGSPIRDERGVVTHLLGTARDVSEREQLRERVHEVDALYRIADAIARATSLESLFAEAVETLLGATAADRAAILLYDEASVMRFVAWHALSDAYRAAAEGHSPWPPDAVGPQPVLVRDAAAAGFPPELARALETERIGSLAFIPLVHDGRLLGKFMLYLDTPHDWSDRDVRLCGKIANHLGSATVRTRARTALRDSQEQLETIMQTVDEGIIVQSAVGEIVYANDSAARIIGFASAAEFLAADRLEVLDRFEMLNEDGSPLEPEDLPGRRALRGETSERVIRYRIKATGEERWSVVRANAVQDGRRGGAALSVSVVHDVTESRLVQARLSFLARASEMLNATLEVEDTLSALATFAVPAFAGHVTVDLYTDGTLRCIGARHVDPEKTELMIALRREYPPTVPEHPVQRAIATGEPQFVPDVQADAESMAHDERHARAIHELANTSGIVVPLAARGRTFGAITFGTVPPQPPFTPYDLELAVELGRRASVALDNALLYGEAEARARATEALEFVDDGVVLVDREEIVRLLNPAAARAFGIKPAKAIGRSIDDVVHDWQTVRDRIAVAPAPPSGSRRAESLPITVRGGERWLSISAVPFPGGTVYAFRDMTEERAVEQLKSDFVSTVSHELRTPLAAIYGAALTLQRDDVRLEESQRGGLLDVISSEADRLARIVNDILWASRLDSGQMSIAIESCDAAALAQRVIDSVRAHAPSTVDLSVETAGALPPAAADPDKLRQVLTNLVDNAVKYSPDGGRVRIALSQAGNRARIRVEDQGLGIPPSEQSRIFEKFFRLDPNLTRGVGGTGLGLYICRELVHRMHGRIWVVSDGRRGSTFTVELPLA